MEESCVSDRLPFYGETEKEAKGADYNAVTDTAASEWASSMKGSSDVAAPVGRSASETRSRSHSRLQAGDAQDNVADHELQARLSEEKCSGLDVEEVSSPALSYKTSESLSRSAEYHTEATVGDSIVPSSSDIDAETDAVADQELPVNIIDTKCSSLEEEQAFSLAVFSQACESLSKDRRYSAEGVVGENIIPCWSEVEDPQHFEEVSVFDATVEGSGETEEAGDGWVTDLSTVSSDMEEGVWKEIRYGRRRPQQGNKQSTKRLPRVALVALFDTVDSFVGDSAPSSPAVSSGLRTVVRGPGSFSVSRRCGPGSRAPNVPEVHPPEESPTEADVWASKRLMATLEAINSRLETVEQCVLSYRPEVDGASDEALAEQRLQLLEMEKRVAGVMSLVGEQRLRRPFLLARVDNLMRRLLRLREVLQSAVGAGGGAGCFTELDVQMALKGARRHLKTAQGAAAKLSVQLQVNGEG